MAGFKIMNTGYFLKSAGLAVTTINLEFQSVLTFHIWTGTVRFTSAAGQAVQNNAVTYLAAGATLDMNGGTYRMLAGTFYGAGGVFLGTLKNEGGKLYLGDNFGNSNALTIRGNYEQLANAYLVVRVQAGLNSLLDVTSLNGVGGAVALGGWLQFEVNGVNLPGATNGSDFLRYVQRNGTVFAGFVFPNPNFWWAFGAGHSFQFPKINQPFDTAYQLVIT